MNYRFTSAFEVSGTKSYRLSSRKVFGEYGNNLQNVPESIRAFLVADPGKSIFQVDQAGAEALIVAYLAEKGRYRRLFDLGIKPHTYIALNLFVDKFRGSYPRDRYLYQDPDTLISLPEWPALNRFISKDPANETYYKLGKKTAHAKSYKMGPRTFRINVLEESQGTIVLSHEEAKRFLDTFDKLFPEILQWQTDLELQVSRDRILYNLFGYPRIFKGRWNGELVREAISFIPQSTVGCLTSYALTELGKFILANNKNWDILINVHDAIVGQAPTAEIEEPCRKVQELFGYEFTNSRGETFRMKSEAMFGASWNKKEMKELK